MKDKGIYYIILGEHKDRVEFMKVLLNKLRKVNKIFLIIYLSTVFLYVVSYAKLFKNLLQLTNVESAVRSIVLLLLGVWLIYYFLSGLVNLILKKHIKLAITIAISFILIAGVMVINYYIGMLNSSIDNLVDDKYVTYTSNLVVVKGTTIDTSSKLGMINNSKDIEGNVLALKLIQDKKLKEEQVTYYASYYEMIYDLLEGKIDGIFLTTNYLTIFSNEEFEGLDNTNIFYSYSEKMENQDTTIVSNKSLTEPFTLLLMGVDSEKDGLNASTSFNGDTLMLITFNPKTLNATMFSIPRDTYVPIACNNNRYAKINSSAAYGTNCVIKTIEQLTNIKIDYYVKINFKGVVDLVEALGGVEVDVEAPDYKAYINAHNGQICEQNSLRQFGEHLICISPGLQTLNGEEALAYARCRHAYLMSDIARNKHQQQLIEALAKKAANKSNIGKLQEILDAITNNIDTNMTRTQMLSAYEVLKNMLAKTLDDGEFLTIEKTYLEYYNLPVRLSNNGYMTAAIGYYPGSLEAIVNLMKANLGLEEKQITKTFSFDSNEEYTPKVTGQGITTGDILVTMPNFVGSTITKAQIWAEDHNMEIHIEFVNEESPYYNADILDGMIANQSVNNGVLINNVSEFTIYVNSSSGNDEPNDFDNVPNNDLDSGSEDIEDSNDLDLPNIFLP